MIWQKNVKFIWSNKAKKAFENLKSKITVKVVLSKFDSEAILIIKADESSVGVGAVLLQKHKNNKISTFFLLAENFLKLNK